MPRVPTVRKADLDRVLKALADAGQPVAGVVVKPGGEVHILTGEPAKPSLSALDGWREKQRGDRAA